MIECVASGTGKRAQLRKYAVAGKTGSAGVPPTINPLRTHARVHRAGFVDDPEHPLAAIAVVLEKGGSGGDRRRADCTANSANRAIQIGIPIKKARNGFPVPRFLRLFPILPVSRFPCHGEKSRQVATPATASRQNSAAAPLPFPVPNSSAGRLCAGRARHQRLEYAVHQRAAQRISDGNGKTRCAVLRTENTRPCSSTGTTAAHHHVQVRVHRREKKPPAEHGAGAPDRQAAPRRRERDFPCSWRSAAYCRLQREHGSSAAAVSAAIRRPGKRRRAGHGVQNAVRALSSARAREHHRRQRRRIGGAPSG